MAGAKDFVFREKLTPFLRKQLSLLAEEFGPDSDEVRALKLQYLKSSHEDVVSTNDRMRHYEATENVNHSGVALRGVERLYRRTILIQPTMACAAHCRWCLRGQYPIATLREGDIVNFAKFCGSPAVRDDLREILITGGDPFLVPQVLLLIFSEVKKHAPNIQFFRIGTRVPVQDPSRVDRKLLAVLDAAAPVKVEIGTHVNHPVELTAPAREAYKKLSGLGLRIYDQSVLLKGVNDSVEVLSRLFDELRYLGIEAHYLFHCIPMRGMSHHRTTVQRGLDLIGGVNSSGLVPGRAKPMYTLMTDLGKTTLYEGSILEKNDDDEILVQTHYRADETRRWNPSWRMPPSAVEDENGSLRVWYPDGSDEEMGQLRLVSSRSGR